VDRREWNVLGLRLFGLHCGGSGQPPYLWTSASHDLQQARGLIEKHGYSRCLEELQDAEAAALHWPCNRATGPSTISIG
jgi:hypothetical protein